MPAETYTVEEHEHGLLVRGPIPIPQLLQLGDQAAAKGWEYLAPGIGLALSDPEGPRVSMVWVSRESGDAWRAEIRAAAQAEHGSDPVMAWLHGPDMGTSSLVVVLTLGTPEQRQLARQRLGPFEGTQHPRDASDLGRCLEVLGIAPATWTERLEELAKVSRHWGALVAIWPELSALHAEEAPSGMASRTTARMREVLGGR